MRKVILEMEAVKASVLPTFPPALETIGEIFGVTSALGSDERFHSYSLLKFISRKRAVLPCFRYMYAYRLMIGESYNMVIFPIYHPKYFVKLQVPFGGKGLFLLVIVSPSKYKIADGMLTVSSASGWQEMSFSQ